MAKRIVFTSMVAMATVAAPASTYAEAIAAPPQTPAPAAAVPTLASNPAPTPNPASTAPGSGAASAVLVPPRLPTAALANRPFLSMPRLSPDGKHIAAWINAHGKELLGVLDVATGQNKYLSLGAKRDLNWFRWAGNGTLLVSVGSNVNWFGDDAWQTRLIAYDVTTGANRFIGGKEEGLIGDDVLWTDPEGKSVLLAYQSTIYDYPSVYSVDLATNRSHQVVGQRTDVLDWYADDSGVVRAGIGFYEDTWRMIYRESADDRFRTVVKAKKYDDDAGFDAFRIFQGSDEGYQILLNEKTGRYALYRFNFAKRQGGDLVYESAATDIEDFDTLPGGHDLLAAWYTDDHPRVEWFEPGLKETQAAIDKAVGSRQATIVSTSRDRKILLVLVGGSNDPGKYYFFNTEVGAMQLYAAVNADLKASQLVRTRYVSYKARDGLEIPAYVTMPSGRGDKNLPLVIMPHGGPYDIRDDGTYDAEVQFLANRGYVVLQPEFRGSGGYGKSFYEKGEGQWGRAMQDDLDDGMDWLARQGTIDPKRVCLIGSSYGGYAALWGAVRNPERYRCAASFAGVSDLQRQLKYQIDFKISKRYRKDWRRTVQGEETFDLKTVSPLYTVDRLKVPVLLMHGDDDQRVPYKQSKLFADALKEAGKTYEFVTLKDEGHGFSTSANMQLWLDSLDAFLAKYNPAN